MNEIKFKAKSSVVINLPAGSETTAIEKDGVIYLPAFESPFVGGGKSATTSPAPDKEEAPATRKPKATPAPAPEPEPASEYAVGQVVTALYPDDGEEYEGTIAKIKGDSVTIDWSDGGSSTISSADITSVVEGGEEAEEEAEEESASALEAGTELSPEEYDQLEEGTKVAVWWEPQGEYYDGAVKSISRKGILIAYDDGTEEFIAPDVHTSISIL